MQTNTQTETCFDRAGRGKSESNPAVSETHPLVAKTWSVIGLPQNRSLATKMNQSGTGRHEGRF